MNGGEHSIERTARRIASDHIEKSIQCEQLQDSKYVNRAT